MSRIPEVAERAIAFRVAVLVALVAAGSATLQQGVGGPAARAVVLVGYPVAFLVAYLTRNHRPVMLRLIIGAAGVAVLATLGASLAHDPSRGFAQLQLPLAGAFLWLLLVQALDSPGRRALLVTLLSTAVLIAIAGVLSLSMAIVPFLVLWAVASVAALVLGQRVWLDRLPNLAPRREARPRAALGAAGAVVAVLLILLVVGSAVFMIAPVAGTSRALTFPAALPQTTAVPSAGGLANPTLGSSDPSLPTRAGRTEGRASFGYFGFSNQLDTATRGRPDNTLVMRVRASAPDYWRAQSFDSWDGRVWRSSQTRPRAVSGGQPIDIPAATDDGPDQSIVRTDSLVQTYYLERPGPNAIFAASVPTKLFFSDRTVFQLPDGSLRAGVQLDAGAVYTVVSERHLATAGALRASNPAGVPPEIRARFAAPPVETDRVRALAADVTKNAPTTYDKVLALEAWMGTHTKYTLDIPPLPPRQDAVDRFLFVDRRGFCEQIGTSLVVMLRSLGVPARLAVGYATGERNPFTGLYEVRAKDAHAWAEVYFPGVGWQAFDPTAHVPLAGDSKIAAAGSGAFAYLQSRIDVPARAPSALGALALAIVAVAAARFVVVRRRRRRDRVEPSWAATRLATLERIGARHGRARSPGETIPGYAAALTETDPAAAGLLHTIASTLDAIMFSGGPVCATHRMALDAALTELTDRWRDAPRRSGAPVLVGS